MKAHHPRTSFRVATALGRTDSDMTAMIAKGEARPEQLHLFRQVLTLPAKIQVLAMMALSDPDALDQVSSARIADIADAMGYERDELPSGKRVFSRDLYKRIEDVGMQLRRREVELLVREDAGVVPDGRKDGATRRKYKTSLVSMSLLQEFGFYYEDDDGHPLNLNDKSAVEKEDLINVLPKAAKTELLKYDAVDDGKPIWAIPLVDEHGNIVRNKDGTARRRPAGGISWRWSTRFANMTRDRATSWRVYLDAIPVLKKYLTKPVTFNLIWLTLFHTEGLIEISYSKLVDHLGIVSQRNRARVDAAIASAFDDMLADGIIDKPMTIRESRYYKPTKKTNRPRRVGEVYQWRIGKRWSTRPDVIDLEAVQTDDGKPEEQKDGKQEIRQ